MRKELLAVLLYSLGYAAVLVPVLALAVVLDYQGDGVSDFTPAACMLVPFFSVGMLLQALGGLLGIDVPVIMLFAVNCLIYGAILRAIVLYRMRRTSHPAH